MINTNIKALAWGPITKATSWHMYFVNGYRFHTKDWSDGKKNHKLWGACKRCY